MWAGKLVTADRHKQIEGVLKKGQVNNTLNRRARMKVTRIDDEKMCVKIVASLCM